jgi:hypothetical protein
MNIPAITTYARKHVFESARFYSVLILFLFFHNLFRYFIVKYSKTLNLEEWLWSKITVGVIITILYLFTAVSALILWKKISPLFKFTWLILFFIALFNEASHFLFTHNVNFYESITGQLQAYVSFTFPILFVGVWKAMCSKTNLNSKLLNLVELFVIINSIAIISCLFFDIEIFKSYPGSNRWGYSGFMARTTGIILSSIVFLREWNNNRHWVKLISYSIIFFTSGTKSGLLTFSLILLFIIIKSIRLRLALLFLGWLIAVCSPYLVKRFIYLSPFWENVYQENGFWGVFSSLRVNNMFVFFSSSDEIFKLKSFFVGGAMRFENLWIEILPFDLFAWFGIIGLFVALRFYFKWLNRLSYLIPIVSSFFYGGLVLEPILMILLGVWVIEKD